MGWQEVRMIEQRMKFVMEVQEGNRAFSEVCRRYGISRKTGYKWKLRYEASDHDPSSLMDISRRPHHWPTELNPEQAFRIAPHPHVNLQLDALTRSHLQREIRELE